MFKSGKYYEFRYKKMHTRIKEVDKATLDEFIIICQKKPFICKRSSAFENDPHFEFDSPYSVIKIEDIEILEMHFSHQSWSIRSGIIFQDRLLFVNQEDGGDEWWALKIDEKGEWIPFATISFKPIIKQGEFIEYMNIFLLASKEQFKNLYISVSDQQIEALWDSLEDVPMNPVTEEIEVPWHVFKIKTSKAEIWQWFNAHHSRGIYWLQCEYESPLES